MRFSVESNEQLTEDDLILEAENSAVALVVAIVTVIALVMSIAGAIVCLCLSIGASAVFGVVFVIYLLVLIRIFRTSSNTRKK